MTLLDKFRTQPRDKHPDAAVRLAYVEEIPLGERDTIAAMARDDDDARVRKAAVSKLMDPAALGRIASEDRDEAVRAQATTMLRDFALDAFEGVSESDSLDAVEAIGDAKLLTQLAKTATRDVVALRALARVVASSASSDNRVLGSIARHAVTEPARRGAFELLRERGDHGEILAVATNGEFKDTALAAAELITDRDELEQIASRSKNKAASKRARGVLREAEERAAREAAAAKDAAEKEAAALADVPPAAVDVAPSEPDPEAARRAEDEARARQEADALARAEEAAAREQAQADARARAEAGAAEAARKDAERRAAQEANDRARREGLARMHNLLGRIEPLAAKSDITLKAADRALRDVRAALGDIPPLPSRQDFDDVSGRLKAAQAALTGRVTELREAADWRQWANAGVQEQLCVKMEALSALEDPEAIATEVRSLQQQWKQAADVPRAKADALWRRFKTAHDAAWAKCEAYFAAQAQERAQNVAKKLALCEKAEALADSTSWVQTAEAIKALQAEWKTIGPVSRGREKQIWERFRSACDRFFTRRHEDLAHRKTEWAENFAKKEALVVKVEALAESTDWDAASAEIKRIQQEWKAIGPVKKSRSEAIWNRFRGACDAFFTRYAQRHDVARAERVTAREAICAELEAIAAASADDPRTPQEILGAVRAIRGRWQQEIAQRGVDPKRARELDDRSAAAFAAVLARWPAAFAGTDLDPDANAKRMDALVRKVEELAASLERQGASDPDALSPTNRLAAMLKEALAANTIGGKVDQDTRWRAAAEDVRHAQASWSRIGAVPDAVRRPLTDRFERACRRITERAGKAAARH